MTQFTSDEPPASLDNPPAPRALPPTRRARLRIMLPQNGVSITECARQIFTEFAARRLLFSRSGTVFRVEPSRNGCARLAIVSSSAFRSELDLIGDTYALISPRPGEVAEKRKPCPEESARALLACRLAGELLPPIVAIVSAPVLACTGPDTAPRLLCEGWHDFNGGLFVTGGARPADMPLAEAVSLIELLIADTDFQTPADRSRAIAAIIAPALSLGGFIRGAVPIDFCEADQSQTGKSYRQNIIAAVYRETLTAITIRKGGVGSIDEDISSRLIAGRPFIQIDNIRGKLDSQLLEAATSNKRGIICARAPHAPQVEVDCSPFFWFLTTNGAETTIDAINRAAPVRIRQRPDRKGWRQFPEGYVLEHVTANQPRFLGAVHAIIRAWHDSGSPRTGESRFSFREWAQACDAIVSKYFDGAPLGDGIEEAKARAVSPFLSWLRCIAIEVERQGRNGEKFTAGELAALAIEEGITPSTEKAHGVDTLSRVIGTGMRKLFGTGDEETVNRNLEGRVITRVKVFANYEPAKAYVFG